MHAQVFDVGRYLGFDMRVLDLGGGFVGGLDPQGNITMGLVPRAINAALEEYFPVTSGIQIMAEPGRYFAGRGKSACRTSLSKQGIRSRSAHFSGLLVTCRTVLDPVFAHQWPATTDGPEGMLLEAPESFSFHCEALCKPNEKFIVPFQSGDIIFEYYLSDGIYGSLNWYPSPS
jgi:Pyridoxal-dependent decarboxylase, pyridoxal binding domain